MSKTHKVDDLTPEEIRDVEAFYASDDDKVTFKNIEEFIQWLDD